MNNNLVNKEFQRIIANNTAMWLNMLDQEANIIMWNSAAENISGYKKEEVLGNNKIWELLYPNEEYRIDVHNKALEIISNGKNIIDFETVITCKDGSNRTLSWNTHNMQDENNNVIGSIAIARDVTKIKANEQELQILTQELIEAQHSLTQVNTYLESRIKYEDDTRLHIEKELAHKSRLASMGEMIDNIAHQWRQPLMNINAILMNIERSYELGKIDANSLESKIKEATDLTTHMSQTIEDFRTFFRKDKEIQVININEVFLQSFNLLSTVLEDITICFDTKNEIKLMGYRSELIQVIISIITNSVEVLKQRKVQDKKLYVSIEEYDEEVKLIIEDNGGGIAPKSIERIFEPYYSTKHQVGGTGLGLYICKVIIEDNMNGSIRVNNSAIGAQFSIILKKEFL